MVQQDNGIFPVEQNAVSVKEQLSKYFAKWPLFMASLLFCLGAGYFFTRYTVPKYIATNYILIKGTQSGGTTGTSDLIESALNGKREVNLNNEMMLMNASGLMERTVAKNGFNVTYYRKGRLINIDIYKDAPFTLAAVELTDSNTTYNLFLNSIDLNGGEIIYGPKKGEVACDFKWGRPFTISGQKFILNKEIPISKDGGFLVKWQPVKVAAAELKTNLIIKAFDSKTDVVEWSVKTENLQKGKDLLNALYSEFNASNIEDRNKFSARTVQFIDERLLNISRELKGVEGNLESYQGSNQLIDIKGQSTQSLEDANDMAKIIKDLSIQQSVVSMILNYFANPVNGTKLVPSSLGLNDPTLASLITQYNEVQLKREREAPSVANNSTVMQDLNAQVNSLKSSILESLSNIEKNLRLRQGDFQQQNSQYRSFLSAIPHNERVLLEIKRKQNITEGLYLYLLQKREEAAISGTSSNISHYTQVDPATGYGPVDPNKRNIMLYSGIFGLFLAFGGIYLRNMLNDKVSSREDITKRVNLPILGEISHISKKEKQAISVNGRTLAGEQFRAIRTNLSFILKNKQEKVIMVTSSLSGEGKSLVSLNLAAVFAIPGKKVALLEFDTRHPVISERLQLENRKGLTDYISGKSTELDKLFFQVKDIPSLHLYPCGTIPVNAADMLLAERVATLFDELKASYDYIVVDTPPVKLVTDGFILGRYSTLVLYIIRQQNTDVRQLDAINEIASNHTLDNIYLILNDAKSAGSSDYGNYFSTGKYPAAKPKKNS